LLIYCVLGSASLAPVIPLTSTTPRQQQGFRWSVQGLVAEFGLAEHWPLSAAIRANSVASLQANIRNNNKKNKKNKDIYIYMQYGLQNRIKVCFYIHRSITLLLFLNLFDFCYKL
jgi:hypothetical protein